MPFIEHVKGRYEIFKKQRETSGILTLRENGTKYLHPTNLVQMMMDNYQKKA